MFYHMELQPQSGSSGIITPNMYLRHGTLWLQDQASPMAGEFAYINLSKRYVIYQ